MISLNLDKFHLEDIQNPKHISNFIQNEHYSLLILRLFRSKSKKTIAYNVNVILQKDEAFVYENDEFVKIGNFDGLFSFLDSKFNEILAQMEQLTAKIEKMENEFYTKQSIKNFNKNWLLYKNNLTKINRILLSSNEVFKTFSNAIIQKNPNLKIKFEDLKEHIERSFANAVNLQESIDTLHLMYSNYNDEKMQKTIYLLTIVSVVFLPLNLIVGFFGINTTTLPFTTQDGGSFLVFLILLVTMIFSVILLFWFKNRRENV